MNVKYVLNNGRFFIYVHLPVILEDITNFRKVENNVNVKDFGRWLA